MREHYVDVEYAHLKRMLVLRFLTALGRANFAGAKALVSDLDIQEHESVGMPY